MKLIPRNEFILGVEIEQKDVLDTYEFDGQGNVIRCEITHENRDLEYKQGERVINFNSGGIDITVEGQKLKVINHKNIIASYVND